MPLQCTTGLFGVVAIGVYAAEFPRTDEFIFWKKDIKIGWGAILEIVGLIAILATFIVVKVQLFFQNAPDERNSAV